MKKMVLTKMLIMVMRILMMVLPLDNESIHDCQNENGEKKEEGCCHANVINPVIKTAFPQFRSSVLIITVMEKHKEREDSY